MTVRTLGNQVIVHVVRALTRDCECCGPPGRGSYRVEHARRDQGRIGHGVACLLMTADASPLLSVLCVREAGGVFDILVAARATLIRDAWAGRKRERGLAKRVLPDLIEGSDLVACPSGRPRIHMTLDAGNIGVWT